MANLGERAREIHVFFHGQGKSTLNPKFRPGMWQDFTVKLVWEGRVGAWTQQGVRVNWFS